MLERNWTIIWLAATGLCAALAGRSASRLVEGALVSDAAPVPRQWTFPPPRTRPRRRRTEDAIVLRNPFCSTCSRGHVEKSPSPVEANRIAVDASTARGHCLIPRSTVERLLAAGPIVSAPRCFHILDGHPKTFRLYAIRPGSVFDLLGARSGDTIERINGVDVTEPDKMADALARSLAAHRLVVDVERSVTHLRLECAFE